MMNCEHCLLGSIKLDKLKGNAQRSSKMIMGVVEVLDVCRMCEGREVEFWVQGEKGSVFAWGTREKDR